jgi:hypothetical protein
MAFQPTTFTVDVVTIRTRRVFGGGRQITGFCTIGSVPSSGLQTGFRIVPVINFLRSQGFVLICVVRGIYVLRRPRRVFPMAKRRR